MPNGLLYGYNKLTNAQFTIGYINEPFSISDNLNDMPSNMKVKIVNSTREEYQVNTICYHEDFNSWWVIKADTSTYLKTGEYEHEIDLVEYFEFLNYRHLIACAFKKDDYTFETMVERVLFLGKVASIDVEYPSFIDKDKKNDFYSFENFTVASALKVIARSFNAIPKMKRVGSTDTIFFVSRNGLDEAPRTTMNSLFPIAFEKNANTQDQFQTRAVSNLENVLSNDLVVSPRIGGYLATTKNQQLLDKTNGVGSIILPSKIDKVEYIKIFPKIRVSRNIYVDEMGTLVFESENEKIYEGYYIDSSKIYDLIQTKKTTSGATITYSTLNDTDLANAIMPDSEEFGKIKLNDGLGLAYTNELKAFAGFLTLKDQLLYTTSSATDKAKTFYYAQRSNELICASNFIKGLTEFRNKISLTIKKLIVGVGKYEVIEIVIVRDIANWFSGNRLNPATTYIQVGYVPIGDLKVSYDNDNEAEDEKFFNQSGKLLDSFATSKLIFSHVQDSVEGTKIRQARYTALGDILPLGALISDGGVVYVINQRSIDYVNGYYSVIYNLSRSRIARSENITADGSIREYAIPENNTVRRNQLYKDYIEFSLEPSITTSTTPYINLNYLVNLTSDYAGARFNYQSFARTKYLSENNKYFSVSTSFYDLYKAKSFVADFIDNAIIGYRIEEISTDAVQTPVIYTGSNVVNGNNVGNGKVSEIELTTTDEALLADAIAFYENPTNSFSVVPFSPFVDNTNIDVELYQNSMVDRSKFVFKTTELTYDKDPFEIPVFTYQVQANDTYLPTNGIVVGERLFTDFHKLGTTMRYHYLITTTKLSSENAERLFLNSLPSSSTNRYVAINRVNQRQIDLTLYSTFNSTLNTTALLNKNVGIYAYDGTDVKFLFGINNYNKTSNSAISVYLNNYKI